MTSPRPSRVPIRPTSAAVPPAQRWDERWDDRGNRRRVECAHGTIFLLSVARMRVKSAQFKLAATSPTSFPSDSRPQIAFLGRSNVGKSSLLNSLLGVRGLARTSSTPGRTQSINFFLINDEFYFVENIPFLVTPYLYFISSKFHKDNLD